MSVAVGIIGTGATGAGHVRIPRTETADAPLAANRDTGDLLWRSALGECIGPYRSDGTDPEPPGAAGAPAGDGYVATATSGPKVASVPHGDGVSPSIVPRSTRFT